MSAPDCRDCKHYQPTMMHGSSYPVCLRAPSPGHDYFSCDIERKFERTGCGKDGKNFEAKRPWWAFWRKK